MSDLAIRGNLRALAFLAALVFVPAAPAGEAAEGEEQAPPPLRLVERRITSGKDNRGPWSIWARVRETDAGRVVGVAWRLEENNEFRFKMQTSNVDWGEKLDVAPVRGHAVAIRGTVKLHPVENTENQVRMVVTPTAAGLVHLGGEESENETERSEKMSPEELKKRLLEHFRCEFTAELGADGTVRILKAPQVEALWPQAFLAAIYYTASEKIHFGWPKSPDETNDFDHSVRRVLPLGTVKCPGLGKKENVTAVLKTTVRSDGAYHILRYVSTETGKVLYGRMQSGFGLPGDREHNVMESYRAELYAAGEEREWPG